MKNKVSNVLSVILVLIILTSIMMITLTATTEADDSFKTTSQEEQGMNEYYASCPFKKAELDDLTARPSIREFVKIVSVECNAEKKQEKVTIQLIAEDKQKAKTALAEWLKTHGLEQSDHLTISVQE